MIFRQLMQMTAFGIGMEVIMGGSSYFDFHYGITGINLEMSNIEELAKSTDKTQVCWFTLLFCTTNRLSYLQARTTWTF